MVFQTLWELCRLLSWSIHKVPQALLHVRPARNFSDRSMEDVASAKEKLQEFIKKLKRLVSKIHVPNATVVKALRKTLWIHSPFKAKLYVNKTITLDDLLHRANCFITMEKDKHIYIVRHNTMKMLASKVAYTYQEPQKHSSDEKHDKKNTIVYSIVENDLIDSAATAPDRPLNVWDILVDRLAPQTYDKTKFYNFHTAKIHDTKQSRLLHDTLMTAFNKEILTPNRNKSLSKIRKAWKSRYKNCNKSQGHPKWINPKIKMYPLHLGVMTRLWMNKDHRSLGVSM